MPIYYYPSGQYPTSTTQQYRPMASVQYSAQRGQQMPHTAQHAGTWSLSPIFSSNPVVFACKSLSWVSIQAWRFKPARFPYPGKIMERLINSVQRGNRYKQVKPPSLHVPGMHAKHGVCELLLHLLSQFILKPRANPIPIFLVHTLFFSFFFNLKRILPLVPKARGSH